MNFLLKNKGFATLQVIIVIAISFSILGFLFTEIQMQKHFGEIRRGGLENQLLANSIMSVADEIIVSKLESIYNNPPSKLFSKEVFDHEYLNVEIQRNLFVQLAHGLLDINNSLKSSRVLGDLGISVYSTKIYTYLFLKSYENVFKEVNTFDLYKEVVSKNVTTSDDYGFSLSINCKKDGQTIFISREYFFNIPYFTEDELYYAFEANKNGEIYSFEKQLSVEQNLIYIGARYGE